MDYFNNSLKTSAKYAGLYLSQKCSFIPFWNSHIEPAIVDVAGVLYQLTDSFLIGLGMDNFGDLDDDIKDFHKLKN